ncbi:adenosylcobalamin-dependent ribonucleoside-diphosphate reductase [Jannaschia sp. W003]|uniref:adenosylcobalamin-dependent ribonucleoside-diphosphate reductase n=1 Tax=Jannaschia sp. W003 TaxID=2867012 RepID=UPI0021A90B26|nr:adenosylcobalamin-dependent ribonucleoside-diphosphate reductase [Jannaschia sp. W003]UWQ22252.1 adenosylcobalamin-dependent ribonucleoside-diphosphate reductase [Jannaschia sp. W003]
MASTTDFAAPIAQSIWDMKYRLKAADGTPVDATIADTWDRIAGALAAQEADPDAHRPAFRAALQDFRFLPAGRIVAGAGTDRSVTLFNCFVMGRIEDDMGAIFAHLREAALTLQQGGGIGYDFSTIRPMGAPVAGVAAEASGPLSFMDVWDSMCRTIMSAGSRRGAMMATLRCDHPDVERFIEAKRDPTRLRMFNLSVLVTDPFMEAVERDADWPLVFEGRTYRTVRARGLWEAILRATYDYAEPGVIFIDRINAENNLHYVETISATNPCGEQPLPPYGACLLGSLNLARLVRAPFEAGAAVDVAELEALTATAVRMLDDVVDASRFPLQAQADEARAKRRIGLGVTGLADALAMCGLRYGSPEAAERTGAWLQRIANAAYRASAELAAEKGRFPLWDDALLEAPMIARLDGDVRDLVARHGLRNALLTSIAPTGTISLLAGNVSSGIEPIFATSYRRRVLLPDGTHREETVEDFAVAEWRRLHGDAPLPGYLVTAQTLEPAEHVAMQAAAQRWVDSSISKTINVPADISFERFGDVYLEAWRTGCKGCTTYRPNAVTGSVLEAEPDVPEAAPAAPRPVSADGTVVHLTDPLDRPEQLDGQTYKLRWPNSEHALYITINDVMLDGRRRPFEIFVNSKNMEHFAWMVGLTRMVSAVFRRGGDVSFVVEELKAVFDPRGGAWVQGRYVPSILAAIGDVIERHMVAIGFLGAAEGLSAPGDGDAPRLPACPRCGAPALRRVEGCATCAACGHSECG